MYNKCKYKNVWPIDQRAAEKPAWFNGWPDNKQFALILRHDVESAEGYKNIISLLDIERSLGFKSIYNLLPCSYTVKDEDINYIRKKGCEIGIHGINHDGKLYKSKKIFMNRIKRINKLLKKYECRGFASPSSFHNLEWIHMLEIEHDSSTFDTDPIEPQNDPACTIFPFCVKNNNHHKFIEIPYTVPQDFTLFIVLREKNINIWKKKIDWIVKNQGMVCMIVHPDYIRFNNDGRCFTKYPVVYYTEILEYIKMKYKDQYWNALPGDVAQYCLNESNKRH